jgi:hypothetical protein
LEGELSCVAVGCAGEEIRFIQQQKEEEEEEEEEEGTI